MSFSAIRVMNRHARINRAEGMKTMTNTEATTTPAAVAEPGAHEAPKKASSTGKAKQAKRAPKLTVGAKKCATPPRAKARKQAATKRATTVPREFSKKAIVLDLLRRKEGATTGDIAKATGWQHHSIRGFISGTLGKKMGLKVESSRNEAGEHSYRIAK